MTTPSEDVVTLAEIPARKGATEIAEVVRNARVQHLFWYCAGLVLDLHNLYVVDFKLSRGHIFKRDLGPM